MESIVLVIQEINRQPTVHVVMCAIFKLGFSMGSDQCSGSEWNTHVWLFLHPLSEFTLPVH